jgi:anti-sigma factor RsiW
MTSAGFEMTCQELVELVTDFLEGRLPADERTRFEMHLCYCDWCAEYVRQLRDVARTAGKLAESSIEPDARDALLAAFRDWRRGSGGSQG